jgi:hypothetical protein
MSHSLANFSTTSNHIQIVMQRRRDHHRNSGRLGLVEILPRKPDAAAMRE